MEDTARLGAMRHTIHLAKWEHGRTPADGEPDEVLEHTVWTEADGMPITDPARIAALEASLGEDG